MLKSQRNIIRRIHSIKFFVFCDREGKVRRQVGGVRRQSREMAESAVSFTIDKLVPLLTQEVTLLKGIREEVEHIKDDLEAIRAFLKDADSKAEKEGINESVKVWVKQAREVAYRVEDVIDEYMLCVAHHRGRGFVGFLQRNASSVIKLKVRHEIVSEIQDARKALQNIKERIGAFQFISSEQGASSKARRDILHDPRMGSLFIEEGELVGIESPRDKLTSYLVDGASQRTVISMVGMGGVGKTTLAKKAYDNQKVKEHFRCRAWATVSQSYDRKELLKSILREIYEAKKGCFPENIVTMDESSLIKKIREFIESERYFIVFDDVWEIGFWEDVEHALLDNNKGSRILITTRKEGVADFCKRYSLVRVYPLEPLGQEDSWELFCKKTFKRDFEGRCPKVLEELSMEIVGRCGGLPLAIVAIGGLLASKEKVVLEWEKLLNSLASTLRSDPYLENVTKIISLSYGDLPYYLKSCLLYLGMFPEDFSVARGRLIRLWVAEGFVQEKEGRALEEVAEEYLIELIHRSLVQVDWVGFKGIPSLVRVHDLVREVILSKSEELSLCHVSSNCSNFESIARHLSISNRENMNGNNSTTKAQTRSIMIFNGIELQRPIIDGMFGKCKLLNTLDFESCPIHHIPRELGNLLHLKYFNLRNTKVSKLPKSIGKLQNLEFLDVRGSLVEELPVKINRFSKLRYLLGDPALKVHGSIGHLEFLQKLVGIRLDGHQDVRLINELGILKQLRRLWIARLKKEYGRDLCTVLEKITQLRSLSVNAISKDEILELQPMSSPPAYLHSLNLRGQLERLPDWVSKLQNVVKLRLWYSRLRDDPAKFIQDLPNLQYLQLVLGYNGEKMHFEGGFQKLKQLDILGLNQLKTMTINKGAMPLLELLYIGACPLLKEVPSGIQHLKDLKEIYFAGMSNEFTQRFSGEQGEDYWIVKHVPIIRYDGTYDADDQTSYEAWVKRNLP